jgi:hypothetical protein
MNEKLTTLLAPLGNSPLALSGDSFIAPSGAFLLGVSMSNTTVTYYTETTKATKRPSVQADVGQCDDCEGTGWYGDNGSGIIGNSEFVRCDCGTGDKCRIGCHSYIVIGGVAWCGICDREADLEICRINHVLPNADLEPARKGV